jgi:SHS2 domain-containing protein
MYRFVDHTAEVELELEGSDPAEVLSEAVAAFAELVGAGPGAETERLVELEARDLTGLLAAWLEELVFVADTEGFVAESADVTVTGASVRARLRGRTGGARPLVKAVTYHRLVLAPDGGVWRGRVVLDV